MKRSSTVIILFYFIFFITSDSKAQETVVEESGQILRIGLPASAIVSSLIIEKKTDYFRQPRLSEQLT